MYQDESNCVGLNWHMPENGCCGPKIKLLDDFTFGPQQPLSGIFILIHVDNGMAIGGGF